MIDIGDRHVREFAELRAEDPEFARNLERREIEKAFDGILSDNIQETEEALCRAFGKFLADKDFVFGSVQFRSIAEREDYAYGYVDIYYRKALLKYFLGKRANILKEGEEGGM